MPGIVKQPDSDALLATHSSGARLYLKDFRESAPLYRDIKIITEQALWDARYTAHLSWVVHQQRLRRGGDSWLLCKHQPEMYAWVETVCRQELPLEYLSGLELDGDLQELIAAEERKYGKNRRK